MDLNNIGNQVIALAKQVGTFIIEQRENFDRSVVEKKGHQDYVSFVDKQAERDLVTGLRQIIPNSGFIVEENSATHQNEPFIWVVDPLDGTTNFIHNLAPHAISIALQKNKQTILGVVYELGHGQMFYSWHGIAAYCNNKEIKVSTSKTIAESLIATGFSINKHARLPNHLAAIKSVVENSHGIRRQGSAATDLAYVAAGIYDGFFEYALNAWDVAAGAYLVKKAGGQVTDYKGTDNYFFGKELVAGNKAVHAELLKLLQKIM